MLLYVLKLNQNAKMPEAYGKYYAYPVITQTVDIDGLAEHMASHNTPFSKGAIKGMITDMVSCVKELTLQGFAVKMREICGKTKTPRGEKFVRFDRFVFKNQALRSTHSTLTINT